MSAFTLHDLQCFDAVARAGGFQAAAQVMNRSHPAVFAAVAKLERQVGVTLLERGGYRVQLTPAGQSFHRRAQALLRELESLHAHTAQLAMGAESELRVVIGDMCPVPQTLRLLSSFFAQHPSTRLHLHFEAITGPWERLFNDDADLIFHHVDKHDARLEWLSLCPVSFIPVAAPGFLPFRVTRSIRREQLRDLTQCIMRDTAQRSQPRDYFVVDGAPQCTVADQLMKKEVILQGMAWGHLPRFLIEQELRDGSLVSLAGQYLTGSVEDLVAARRHDRPHGPVANQLWEVIRERAGEWRR
ncbi:LysR family transcriptional regulator [Dyella terrae]|uniref:LysR family transcriptional regulator n=3 Tax=Dyella TaxID=231454 RepID=A0A4R0YNC0_9GAMM|nr:LysR family transcriptional regulator [Dyella terrae]TBR36051.1 LysR family transcriptional regulator [Dyella terrae]TCI06101.1 LysR family transcriptional regulator [Dyella soli]